MKGGLCVEGWRNAGSVSRVGETLALCRRLEKRWLCVEGWRNAGSVSKAGETLAMCRGLEKRWLCVEGWRNAGYVSKVGETLAMCRRLEKRWLCVEGWRNAGSVSRVGETLALSKAGETLLQGMHASSAPPGQVGPGQGLVSSPQHVDLDVAVCPLQEDRDSMKPHCPGLSPRGACPV
ncbi:UNVERIFIED_CONTAM: hypothetical protein FKN15_005266 [Acipenser sinensis]